MTSHRESSRRTRQGEERLTWLVLWPTQSTNRTGRSGASEQAVKFCDDIAIQKTSRDSSPRSVTVATLKFIDYNVAMTFILIIIIIIIKAVTAVRL